MRKRISGGRRRARLNTSPAPLTGPPAAAVRVRPPPPSDPHRPGAPPPPRLHRRPAPPWRAATASPAPPARTALSRCRAPPTPSDPHRPPPTARAVALPGHAPHRSPPCPPDPPSRYYTFGSSRSVCNMCDVQSIRATRRCAKSPAVTANPAVVTAAFSVVWRCAIHRVARCG